MRYTAPGINWIWYYADTKEEAEDYFKELTGKEPESWTICDPIRNGSKYDDKYGFRIHK